MTMAKPTLETNLREGHTSDCLAENITGELLEGVKGVVRMCSKQIRELLEQRPGLQGPKACRKAMKEIQTKIRDLLKYGPLTGGQLVHVAIEIQAKINKTRRWDTNDKATIWAPIAQAHNAIIEALEASRPEI